MAQAFDPDQIRAQHRRVRDTLAALEEVFDATTGEGAHPARALAVLSRDLYEGLRVHFDAEENDEQLARVRLGASQVSVAIARLQADHDALRSDARDLARRCAKSGASPARWNEARDYFVKLAAKLDVHERTEDELFQRAYNEDVGAAG